GPVGFCGYELGCGGCAAFAALLLADGPVALPGRDVVVPGEVHIEEPLVVAEVQVDLRAVVEDEHLAVLVRIHRPRVDVQVGIDLDRTDLQTLRLQEDADGRGADSLPEARQNATRDDDIFHVKSRDWSIRRVDDKVCVQEWRNTCSGITPSRDTSVEATRQASRRGIKPKIPDGSALNSARPPAHASMCTEAPPSTSWAVTTKFRGPV